ncbi:MAG: hypothetical protein LLG02_02660 [Pelosinus sp.]|nr:hypothetical protein [Pelosinus sp.]
METIIIIGLMVLVYIVPEIMRKANKKEYKYPDIPQTKPKPKYEEGMKHLPHIPPAAANMLPAKALVKEKSVMPPAVEVPNFIEQQPVGSNSVWINGVIMAEVLQAPRARRPLLYHKKR